MTRHDWALAGVMALVALVLFVGGLWCWGLWPSGLGMIGP